MHPPLSVEALIPYWPRASHIIKLVLKEKNLEHIFNLKHTRILFHLSCEEDVTILLLL
jgi:hypothetical protein